MRESTLQKKMINILNCMGARPINIAGGKYQESGISDLLICYKSMFFAFELKTGDNKPTRLQRAFITDMRRSGAAAYTLTANGSTLTVSVPVGLHDDNAVGTIQIDNLASGLELLMDMVVATR